MGAIVLIIISVLGCAVSAKLATKAMERWNSRGRAVAIGVLVPPVFVVAGAFVATLFYSAVDLQQGGIFGLGLLAYFGSGLTAMIGGAIAGFIAVEMWQPEEEE